MAHYTRVDVNDSSQKPIVGTPAEDVVVLGETQNTIAYRTFSLSDLNIQRRGNDVFITNGKLPNSGVTLRGFDPNIDKIQVSEGQFTLAEIFRCGVNAPLCKTAAMTADLLRK